MNIARVNQDKALKPAIALQYQLNHDHHAYQILEVQYGEMEKGLTPLVYLQSHCGSPFLGSYMGAITPEDLWVALNFNEKDVIYEKDYKKAELVYPDGFPQWFQSLSAEDYDKNFCIYVCSHYLNVIWSDYFRDEPTECRIPGIHSEADQRRNKTAKLLCNPHHCNANQVTTTLNYFVDHLRNEDKDVKYDRAPNDDQNIGSKIGNTHVRRDTTDDSTKNKTKIRREVQTFIWVKTSIDFFSSKMLRDHKTLPEFIAELGGHLGFWVGASILTLAEIAAFFSRLCKKAIWEKFGKVDVYTIPHTD